MENNYQYLDNFYAWIEINQNFRDIEMTELGEGTDCNSIRESDDG